MPAAAISSTRKTMTKTRTTTGRFGRNTGGLSKPAARPSGDPYLEVCEALHALLTRKRGYYGCMENPLENALGVAEDGIEPWRYQAARIGEKCRRLRGLSGDTGIRETLMDIAGHAVVAIACLDSQNIRGSQDEPCRD